MDAWPLSLPSNREMKVVWQGRERCASALRPSGHTHMNTHSFTHFSMHKGKGIKYSVMLVFVVNTVVYKLKYYMFVTSHY